jgi:spore coat protein U domain-containing protein, fimbrial subunit CupE1/2/3/6
MTRQLKIKLTKWLLVVLLANAAVAGLSFSVWAVCSLSSTSIIFGTYDVFSTSPLDTNGSIVYRCGNSDHDISVSLDQGGAPSFNPRRMLKGSEALSYNLYLDAARTTIWGDGTAGTQTYFIKNPPNNQDVAVPIYGRVPTGQSVSKGAYSNTITVTINF